MKKVITPNRLTIFRILIVIPYLVLLGIAADKMQQLSYKEMNDATILVLISSGIFMLAMLTDFFDGYLARKWNMVSNFGKLFDPLADKFLISSTMVMMTVMNILPWYITVPMILRDLLVDGSRNLAAKYDVDIAANWFGKTKTVAQTLGLIILFFAIPGLGLDLKLSATELNHQLILIPMYIALVASLFSGYTYFKAIQPILIKKS